MIHKIAIGNQQYNLAEATAPKQRELLSIVGSKIAYNQASSGVDIDDNMLVGLLLTMTDGQLQTVSDIVLWKTVKNGTDKIVSIDDFHSSMSVYLQLIAGGVRANLLDFFDYLQSVSRDARKGMTKE